MKQSDKSKCRSISTFRTLGGLVCCVFLANCGPGEEVASDETEQNVEEVLVSEWRIFRGNSELQGVSEEVLEPPLNLAWTFETPGDKNENRAPVDASPVIADGKVFVGTQFGDFVAIDLETGEQLWVFEEPGAVSAPAAVFDGMVFFGDQDGFVFCLDAETGEEKWRFETWGKIEGGVNALVTEEGELRIFIGSHDNSLYCLNAETGEEIWSYETGNYIVATPAIINSSGEPAITFGGCDALLHILPVSGDEEQKREVEIGAYVANSAAVRDGICYVAHNGGEILAIDVAAGEEVWRIKTGAEYTASPAVGEKLLFVASPKNDLTAFDRVTGEEKWKFLTRRSLDSSPVISGEIVWQAGIDGRLYAVNAADGTEAWSFDVGTKIKSSPAVSRGTLVVGGDDGRVYAFRK